MNAMLKFYTSTDCSVTANRNVKSYFAGFPDMPCLCVNVQLWEHLHVLNGHIHTSHCIGLQEL